MRFIHFFLGLLLFFSFAYGVEPSRSPAKAVVIPHVKRHPRGIRRTAHRPHQVHPLIIVDAGHGGRDQGAKVDSILEKRLALSTAILLKRALEQSGYRVIMTRSRDVYLSLKRRAALANKMEGTLFVSVHFNTASNQAANGVEIYFYQSKQNPARTKESKHLANCVLYKVVDETVMASRGVKERSLHVIRETEMPAVLVEGGFMTNPKEFSNLKNREFLEKLAKGIAKGIDQYLKS